MGLGEIAIILVVALILIKHEDLPHILRHFHQIRQYILQVKQEIANFVRKYTKDIEEGEPTLEEVNFYLAKIISVEGRYDGKYELSEIRNHYYFLLKQKQEAISIDDK